MIWRLMNANMNTNVEVFGSREVGHLARWKSQRWPSGQDLAELHNDLVLLKRRRVNQMRRRMTGRDNLPVACNSKVPDVSPSSIMLPLFVGVTRLHKCMPKR